MGMVTTRTPYRISFFGGGTDYPAHYAEHGGTVLHATINKYCYITCRSLPPFFEHTHAVRYSRQEYPNAVDEIVHPSVRECFRRFGVEEGLEVTHSGDIPAMSGVGSSSAFTVGLVHALAALKGRILTKREMAQEAIHIEQKMIGENVGSQDQVAAAFGGFNLVEFNSHETFRVKVMPLGPELLSALQDRLMLFYTGISRFSSDIAREQIENAKTNKDRLFRMRQMAYDAADILAGGEGRLDDFGRLLHESWLEKRGLGSKVTTDGVDRLYETARKHGALGGKLCGAGGGGFFMLFVPPERRPEVQEALKDFLLVPFRFEHLGSHIAFFTH